MTAPATDATPAGRPEPAPHRSPFALDVRALAAFRVALALCVLADLAARAVDLAAHYTDGGVLPRAALAALPSHDLWLSVHTLAGGAGFQAFLFAAEALAAVCLLAGYRTRVATLVVWALHLSLLARNPLLRTGADQVVRMCLFWAMFLPLGTRWSLDRLAAPADAPDPPRLRTPATVALTLQIAFIFWFTAALKSPVDWWREGSATWYALHDDHFASHRAALLLALPDAALRLLTRAVWVAEIALPVLLFLPWWRARLAGVVALWAMLAGFATFLHVGQWPWITSSALLAFVPGPVWDALAARVRAPARLVARLRRRTRERPLRVASGRLARAAVWTLLAYVFLWNLATVDRRFLLPGPFYRPAHLLRLDQEWSMFAPAPARSAGWTVVTGRRADGRTVFLLPEGAAQGWERPAWPGDLPATHRWRLYLWQIWYPEQAGARAWLADFLCLRWNADAAGADRLTEVRVFYMGERTLPGDERPPPQRHAEPAHRCPAT